jgi:hypothetical protein
MCCRSNAASCQRKLDASRVLTLFNCQLINRAECFAHAITAIVNLVRRIGGHVADVVSEPHTKEEIRLSQERRDGIINYLLEWLTGDQVDSKTLGHFRFLAEVFGITSKVKDMVKASSIQGRQELAVTVALAALNVALDDSPLQPTERQEARVAAKQFEQRVAVLKSAGVAGDANPPVKPDKSPQYSTGKGRACRRRSWNVCASSQGSDRLGVGQSLKPRKVKLGDSANLLPIGNA